MTAAQRRAAAPDGSVWVSASAGTGKTRVLTERVLRLLCKAVGIDFTDRMLSWPPGRRSTDGVWAKYWYESVEKTTGFEPYRPKPEPVPAELADVHARCDELYAKLHEHRLV